MRPTPTPIANSGSRTYNAQSSNSEKGTTVKYTTAPMMPAPAIQQAMEKATELTMLSGFCAGLAIVASYGEREKFSKKRGPLWGPRTSDAGDGADCAPSFCPDLLAFAALEARGLLVRPAHEVVGEHPRHGPHAGDLVPVDDGRKLFRVEGLPRELGQLLGALAADLRQELVDGADTLLGLVLTPLVKIHGASRQLIPKEKAPLCGAPCYAWSYSHWIIRWLKYGAVCASAPKKRGP